MQLLLDRVEKYKSTILGEKGRGVLESYGTWSGEAAVAVFADKNGSKHAPGKADYYFSSAALSHARPVHGQSGEAAGFGRADLAEAVDRLEKP